jgi:hypothetical protein
MGTAPHSDAALLEPYSGRIVDGVLGGHDLELGFVENSELNHEIRRIVVLSGPVVMIGIFPNLDRPGV